MTLREGDEGQIITLQATAPPYVLCRGKVNASDECSIKFQVRSSYISKKLLFFPVKMHISTSSDILSLSFSVLSTI